MVAVVVVEWEAVDITDGNCLFTISISWAWFAVEPIIQVTVCQNSSLQLECTVPTADDLSVLVANGPYSSTVNSCNIKGEKKRKIQPEIYVYELELIDCSVLSCKYQFHKQI